VSVKEEVEKNRKKIYESDDNLSNLGFYNKNKRKKEVFLKPKPKKIDKQTVIKRINENVASYELEKKKFRSEGNVA
jgi:hypothetical protein